MSRSKKNRDLDREEKQNLREFLKLNKTELIEIIYKLQDMNLAIKARNVELERMLEERGGLINSLSNTVGALNNALNKAALIEDKQEKFQKNTQKDFILEKNKTNSFINFETFKNNIVHIWKKTNKAVDKLISSFKK